MLQLLCRATLLFALTIGAARAANPSTDFLNFGTTAFDSILQESDDETVEIVFPFTFYGTNYSTIYVSTNGAISLGDDLSTVITVSFPLENDEPLIAPFFADVDTRARGSVWYRTTNESADIAAVEELIRYSFAVHQTFTPLSIAVVTWDEVGYYRMNVDKANTFQCVLATNDQLSFVGFLYGSGMLQWTTGDINGGVNGLGGEEAQVGFNSGSLGNHFLLPGSQTAAVLDLDKTSNIRRPGIWVYQVDGLGSTNMDQIVSGNVVDCEAPDLPDDVTGGITVSAPTTLFGSIATYSCSEEGNVINGSASRVCLGDGMWSGVAPECTVADCDTPEIPNDTIVTVTTTTFASIAVYTCEDGYMLVGGNQTRTCLANEIWSGNVPYCELVECSKLDLLPLNTTGLTINSPRITFGAIASYECSEAYQLEGVDTRECEADGTWTDTAPTCQLIDCGTPDLPATQAEGINVIYTSSLLGDVVIYTCNPGYTLIGNDTRMCLDNNEWSDDPPQCQIVDCGEPDLAMDVLDIIVIVGDDEANETTFNSMANYFCIEEGFVPVGSSTRICGSDGLWTGVAPTECELVDCGEPDFPEFGARNLLVSNDNSTFDSIAVYACMDGDTLEGVAERICQSNGTWSGQPPRCTGSNTLTDAEIAGIIVGSIIGCFLLLLLLLLLCCLILLCCYGKRKDTSYRAEDDYEARGSTKTATTCDGDNNSHDNKHHSTHLWCVCCRSCGESDDSRKYEAGGQGHSSSNQYLWCVCCKSHQSESDGDGDSGNDDQSGNNGCLWCICCKSKHNRGQGATGEPYQHNEFESSGKEGDSTHDDQSSNNGCLWCICCCTGKSKHKRGQGERSCVCCVKANENILVEESTDVHVEHESDEYANSCGWYCCIKMPPRRVSPHHSPTDKEPSNVASKGNDASNDQHYRHSRCGICCFRSKSPSPLEEKNDFPDDMDEYSVKEFNLIYDDTASLASALSGRRSIRSKRPVEHVQ